MFIYYSGHTFVLPLYLVLCPNLQYASHLTSVVNNSIFLPYTLVKFYCETGYNIDDPHYATLMCMPNGMS